MTLKPSDGTISSRRPGPEPAAAVIVLRAVAGQVYALLMRRSAELRFLGGYWVFPGGVVDAAESVDANDVVAAAAIAACRELREESGLELRTDELLHWAHWLTPSTSPRRFDTHFFVALAPPDQEPRIVSGEMSGLNWLHADDWLTVHDVAERPFAAPTAMILRELHSSLLAHRSLRDLIDAERRRAVHCVLPKVTDGDTVVLPWDPHYASLPGDGILWGSEALSERRGWPSRLPARR
jgi:8-oxo-dGTP pyrophosphatase MutT (NUDIX family)